MVLKNVGKAVNKVVAFDPGITTGIANGVIPLHDGAMGVSAFQAKWDVNHCWTYLHSLEPNIIIFESFEYRNKARDGLELFSRELIGVIRLYALLHPEVLLYKQSPSEAIGGFYTNKELKRNHVYQTSKDHAMDALRHLLQWYTFGPGYKFNSGGFRPY